MSRKPLTRLVTVDIVTTPGVVTSTAPEVPRTGLRYARAAARSGDELEQGGVHLIGMGPGDGVRALVDTDELDVLDHAGQPLASLRVRQDPVVVALDHQHRDVDLRQVRPEVGLPGRDAAHDGDR